MFFAHLRKVYWKLTMSLFYLMQSQFFVRECHDFYRLLINIEISSAKAIEKDSCGLNKSFVYKVNNNGPKIDPWGTPVVTSDELE